MVLIELVEEITDSIDTQKYVVGAPWSQKKFWYSQSWLLRKLEKYRFCGHVLDWLKSYLPNRQQFVQTHQNTSDLKNITCGVPQGSVLGPKLFILYINDIYRVLRVLKFVLFADDTNIFCSGVELQQLFKTTTKEINMLKKWFDTKKLSLNLSKINFMLFGITKYIPM